MNLKSFKRFLTEMPLPIGSEHSDFDSKPGNYSSAKIIKKFEEIGMKIGKGSSRVAFKVMVEASQFDPKVLKEYGFHPTANVETVFKLALNPKGISQNKAEIINFRTAQDLGHEKYILPILDTSARNKGYVYADEELSNWIQMPVAPPPSKAVFKKMFEDMYGKGTFEKFRYSRKISDIRYGVTSLNLSDEQNEALDEFIMALEDLQLRVGDLGISANWGVWNEKLYIIDYGFDESNVNLYRGTQVATVYVDGKGEMTMNTNDVKRNRGW